MSTPINVIFMHSHNTGRYIQPYGHKVSTPNLQKLAEEGVMFRNAHSAAPTCSPSRAAFLSGMWAHSCGMFGLAHRGFAMADYQFHCVSHFNEHGYVTALAGVEHTAPDTEQIGYSQILTNSDPNYDGTHVDATDAAVEFLSNPPDKPFFLSLGLMETHIPFPDPDPAHFPDEDYRFTKSPAPLPDNEITRRNMAGFAASARIMDEKYGRVLRALEESNLAEHTLVFCFSDHGLQFPRNMCNLTDHGTAVYCIARGPGGFSGGKVIDQMMSLIDVLPTAYQVSELPVPDHIQGRSLTPLLANQAPLHRELIFAESTFHAAYEPMRSVRSDRYKYIRRYDNRDRPVLPNMDDGPSKDFLLQSGWTEVPRDQEMLYDLVFDPNESDNIADRPEVEGEKGVLAAALDGWMRDTGDPIWGSGSVDLPEGCVVNDPDGLSPREKPS